MIDEFSNQEEQGTIFESFSDLALCTLAVALLLVALLAMNITQNLTVPVNRSTFSGGVMRPSLYLECTVPLFAETTSSRFHVERLLFSDAPYVAVHLFSPSLALIATDVRGGGTVALGENQTFAQQQDLSLFQFMQLVPGIDPGTFEANGKSTALLLPEFPGKQIVYEPEGSDGYRAGADRHMTKTMLAALWPIYAQPLFPEREPEEYNRARTRIYVETQTVPGADGSEQHFIVIGHAAYKLPEALDDGSLAWLGGFSSGLTEIVFLGELWSDDARKTNKRIEFFEQGGFAECARAYRAYSYPEAYSPAQDELRNRLLQAGLAPDRVDARARQALAQRQASAALLAGRLAENEGGFFPPLLAYRDAWSAYVDHYGKEQPDPPKWFYSQFLDRLGFDRLAIDGAPRE